MCHIYKRVLRGETKNHIFIFIIKLFSYFFQTFVKKKENHQIKLNKRLING
jgi:hypothetical protein